VSRQTIIRYESGRAVAPRPEELRAVCGALDLDVRDAIVALGLATREELELPPPPPRMAPPLQRAQRLLNDPKIPDAAKHDLEELIDTSIEFWYRRQGVRQPAREPSAAARSTKPASSRRK
jgi:transcriptional regulator with XRE-family HTH domain